MRSLTGFLSVDPLQPFVMYVINLFPINYLLKWVAFFSDFCVCFLCDSNVEVLESG